MHVQPVVARLNDQVGFPVELIGNGWRIGYHPDKHLRAAVQY
jgi:hypothetical protein